MSVSEKAPQSVVLPSPSPVSPLTRFIRDNRRPLSDAGIATIGRTVEAVAAQMRSEGVPAGGALARRLFS